MRDLAAAVKRTIWKFDVGDSGRIKIPRGARILSVQCQHGDARIWALVDPNAPKVEREIHIAGTGHEIPVEVADSFEFIDTFQLYNGSLVFHLFIQKE